MIDFCLTVLLTLLLGIHIEAKTCPITEVLQYAPSCGLNGTIQNPVYIDSLQGFKNTEACAKTCLSVIKCHSFNYNADTAECTLYELHVENMNFTENAYQGGLSYDRYCFSTDCNEIAACRAIKSCHYAYTFQTYWEYACGYGVTSVFDTYSTTDVVPLTQDYSACDAVIACSNAQSNRNGGAWEVHWDLTKQQWICFLTPTVPHNFHYGGVTPGDKVNNISYHTFTVRDKNVGASYGYFLEFFE